MRSLAIPLVVLLAGCGNGFISRDADGRDTAGEGDTALDGVDGEGIPDIPDEPVCGDGIVSGDEECDDADPGPCTTECGSTGTEECVDCVVVSCVIPEETCNDADDDCDDSVDEDLADCRCTSEDPWDHEECNDIDDDCNGAVDDGLDDCRCTADEPLDHEDCNGMDDDCDGSVDEDLTDCQCTGGGSPTAEVCDRMDNDCDGSVDEENTRTSPPGDCLGFGASCVPDRRECSSGLCTGDDFEHYCTELCDPSTPDPPCTAPAYRCYDDPDPTDDDICRRNYAPCDRESGCASGESCTVQVADDGVTLVTECRPDLGTGVLDDACASDDECTNGLCYLLTYCTEICHEASDCDPGYSCVMVSHREGTARRYIPMCMVPCGDDTDCTRGTLTACQPAAASPSPYVGIGFCTTLYTGTDRLPTGGDCDHYATPPVFCEHGICSDGGSGVCTEVCIDNGDCALSGWTCASTTVTFGAPIGSVPMRVCDPP